MNEERRLRLSEIIRELAELLENHRRQGESWDLEVWDWNSPDDRGPDVQFIVRDGFGPGCWNVRHRVEIEQIKSHVLPSQLLGEIVQRAYSSLRSRTT
jgi:hypothetical protein